MNKNTVYILQKDALTVVNYQSFVIPKGAEFHYMKDAGRYVCKENWCWYDEKFVENNPEWFKPKEQVNESKPTELPILNFNDNDKKIFSYSDVWDIINSCSKQITIDNKGYLHSLFYTEACKQSKSKTEQPLWEILSFVNTTHNILLKKGGDGYFREKPHHGGSIESLLLSMPHMAIHSVKRLRDDTVWSVDMMTEHGKISAFRILGGIMIADITDSPYPLNFLYLSQLKAPKEEQVPIKVHFVGRNHYERKSYEFITDKIIPASKYQSIKEAIESIINYDKVLIAPFVPNQGYRIDMSCLENVDLSNSSYFTKEELLQARRDAFDAAREVVGYSDALKNSPVTVGRKYKDNEDYINSLNK